MFAPTGRTPFVGRDRELAALVERLGAAGQGAGGIVLIAGEPGIGKTRLVTELAEQAREAGWLVLTGRAYESEGMPPYLPFVEALREFVRACPPETLRTLLGEDAADVALLVREVRTRLPDLPAPAPLSPELERYALFESVTDFLLAIARGDRGWGLGDRATPPQPPTPIPQPPSTSGLLLVLDDLHWAEAPTHRLLVHLARKAADAPLLVAGTYRDVEAGRGSEIGWTLAALSRAQASERMHLGGLSRQDVARFVEQTAGIAPPPALVSALYEETEGNPFFVAELVRLLRAEGRLDRPEAGLSWRLALPQSVREVIGRRLELLAPDCERVLTIAAIVGREFGLNALQRVAEMTPDPLLQALDEAEEARLIAPTPDVAGRFGFTHPLIRQTLYERLPAGSRVRLHRQVGDALESFYAANPELHLSELAHHFFLAAPGGDPHKAVSYARRAGDRSLALFAYEEAAKQYTTAIEALALAQPVDEAVRADLLLALAEAQTRAGETARAKETFLRSAGLARELGARGEARQVASMLARAAVGFGGYRGTPGVVDTTLIALAEEALAALGDEVSTLRARVLARLAMELYYTDARERRDTLSREAVEVARRTGDAATLAATLVGRHYALHEPENLPDRLTAATELVWLAESAGDREIALQGHYLRLADVVEMADGAAMRAEIDAHARLSAELRQPLYTWRTDLLLAMLAMLEGRFDEGAQLAQRAYVTAERAQLPNAAQAFAGQIALVRWEQGRLGELAADAAGLVARYPGMSTWRAVLALVYLEAGREADARTEFTRLAAAGFEDVPRDENWFNTITISSVVCAALGERDAAPSLAGLLRPFAGRFAMGAGGVVSMGPIARCLGLLTATMDHHQEAADYFEQAIAISERMGARAWVAHIQHDYAAMLFERMTPADRGQDEQMARELLDASLAAAEELGMTRLAQLAQSLQTAQGLRATSSFIPHPSSFPDGLTIREVEVLRLLAEGRTNKEIASALVLSMRTVDHHIANIYRKIGARRRADATGYALRHGLTGRRPDARR